MPCLLNQNKIYSHNPYNGLIFMRDDKIKCRQQSQKKKKSDEEKQHYLITSEHVLDRLQWDLEWSTLLQHIVIGYWDRFLGMQEITVPDFLAQTDIPMHRIYYFAVVLEKKVQVLNDDGKMEDQIQEEKIRFWDRETRTDHFSKKQILSTLREKNDVSSLLVSI